MCGVMAEKRNPRPRARALPLAARLACLMVLGLAPAMYAHGQMCSEFVKCLPGYRCVKAIPGAVTGMCTKMTTLPTDEKEKALTPCHMLTTRDVCEKLDHCNWPQTTEACVVKCELRKGYDECSKPGRCRWIPQTAGCISSEPPR